MIAVAPKGENELAVLAPWLDRRGSRETPAPLEDNRIDLRASFFAPGSATAAIRQLCKGERPTPPVLFFLDAPAKAQA